MVSNRTRYISESTTDDEAADMEYLPDNQVKVTYNFVTLKAISNNISDFQQAKPNRKPTRTPKCFTKNALMARENRLKKKMYINSLETQVACLKSDNKKLVHTVDSQAITIDELKKEVKYLKSILANSEGIGKLIRAINSSTGMAVTSSLDKKLTLNSKQVRSKSPIAQKTVPEVDTNKNVYTGSFDITRHPWEETQSASPYVSYPTPESTANSCYGSPEFQELNEEGLLLDMDIPIEMNNDELLNMIDEKALESQIVLRPEEHDYHNPVKIETESTLTDEDDVGVCLHVSKNKVSLEFCPTCSDGALQGWKAS